MSLDIEELLLHYMFLITVKVELAEKILSLFYGSDPGLPSGAL